MTDHPVATHAEWLAARQRLLAEEKAFTKARDRLSAARRALPWEPVDDYRFDGPGGAVTLSDLFRGRSQLIVYHLMFHPDWNAACNSCSFWADNFERIVVHLNARDTNLAAVSRAPAAKLESFKRRMGWTFEWVSCGAAGGFNRDFGVSFTPEEVKQPGANYNYGSVHFGMEDAPGLSVFAKDESGKLFHTYSTYSRGLDMLNGAYHYLDILPKGRGEEGLRPNRAWLRLRDDYPAA
jgi:predicted dithiol-disulfide oxidoreductase (DUF899 family)